MKTTWDGAPVSPEKPYGATVLVYRTRAGLREFLVLHRTYNGPDYEGDWAWTPPSGARYPGEPVARCAARELAEETGLEPDIWLTGFGSEEWWVYIAEVPEETRIRLSVEHDRWEWVPLYKAARMCQPEAAGGPFLEAARLLDG